MPDRSIAAGFARALTAYAASKGADRSALLAEAGIVSAESEDQDGRVPFANYVALMRAAKLRCADPALALHFGEAAILSELSIVGLIGEAAPTLQDAFVQLNRYGRLALDGVTNGERYVLERSDEGLWIVDTRENPNEVPEITESSFARMICTPRRAFGVSLVKTVHVTHAPPDYFEEYERVLGVPVVFSSHRNALLTDDAWLTLRAPRPSRYVFGVLCERADNLVEALDKDDTLRGKVERSLLPLLHTGDVGLARIAQELNMSARTLSRHLSSEGVTFEGVLNALRRRLALQYLAGGKISLHETAYLLGYSEQSAFSRAFKRWTGQSPVGWRAALKSTASPTPTT
jgi:AraC-like DNA-binding protein